MAQKWSFINKSVTGASHIRSGTACQDYSLCTISENGSLPMILAAADGHGGKRYVRSAQGAVFACEAAVSTAHEYCKSVFSEFSKNPQNSAAIIKQLAESRLKTDILRSWREKCLSHAKKNPFTDDELSLLGGVSDEIYDTLAAYGTTLLLAVVIEGAIICVQLGDGDILFYSKKENVSTCPLPSDDALIGNETTSMCSKDAPFNMRHFVQFYYQDDMPDLIMLSTDGYANSFAQYSDYLLAPKDYFDFIKTEGESFVAENIGGWLAETSGEGSGDDITAVCAFKL